ncbi:MAG: histidine kinase [Leptothrix sp. (in: b-proteobacteria)]
MPRTTKLRRLRVLHLEDSELDHHLLLAHLRRGGVEPQMIRVDTESGYLAALGQSWDAVLSDYNLPGFSGLVALELLRERDKLMPFILVSGEIGEDTAVEAMRNGASDYLLKSNLARLVPAVMHAVEACETQRARQRADAELAQSRKRLSELAQHLQTSIEMERTAIAREIHDDVGGSLTAVKFDLAWIVRHAGTAQQAQMVERAQQALESVNHAIEASQRIMHNLRPAILEQGLVAALQWMTQRFERRSGIATAFRTSHDHLSLPTGVPLVAYRTAQEALTNISKHAQATRVQVDLTVAAGVLSLEVSDNGRGLASGDLGKTRSFGIRGLHERADTVGGWVDLSSTASGTTLILSVPLEPRGRRRIDADGFEVHEDEATTRPHDPSTWGDL